MLTIRCAGCRRKLFRYEKIGKGRVLRCYKSRIRKTFSGGIKDGIMLCECGKSIARDTDQYFEMIQHSFTYTGTKQDK